MRILDIVEAKERLTEYNDLLAAHNRVLDKLVAAEIEVEVGYLRLWTSTRPGHVTIEICHDIPAYKSLRRQLPKSWKLVDAPRGLSDGTSMIYEFRDPDEPEVCIEVWISADEQGSTCRLVPIGETKPETIYRVVCD